MKNLDERIEEKREAMNVAIADKGLMDKNTIKLSQELDLLLNLKIINEGVK